VEGSDEVVNSKIQKTNDKQISKLKNQISIGRILLKVCDFWKNRDTEMELSQKKDSNKHFGGCFASVSP
jgi:hypothetical protein